MTQLAIAIVAIAFIAALFLAWYFNFQAKKEERMLLLEKGTDPSELPNIGKLDINFSFPWLKLGIIFTCGSIGLMLGVLVDTYRWLGRPAGAPLLGMLVFGGIGLILAHYVGRSDDRS